MSPAEVGGDPTYAEYLRLDRILSAQELRSSQHDELLFIVIHQVSELWMRLSLHELGGAREQIRRDELGPAFKMIARVVRIQEQLIGGWDVLATLTPTDYTAVRAQLGSSSGFQSHQNRLVEFLLGLKNAGAIAQQRDPQLREALERALVEPSLYDEAVRLLSRRGFAIPSAAIERDWREPYAPHPEITAAWAQVYRDPSRWWDLYELAEKLVDLETRYAQWRFAHLKTVERIIGGKMGTGGSSGVGYLQAVVAKRFFPELVDVRSAL